MSILYILIVILLFPIWAAILLYTFLVLLGILYLLYIEIAYLIVGIVKIPIYIIDKIRKKLR